VQHVLHLSIVAQENLLAQLRIGIGYNPY
jgi:hypothetical protein